MTILNVAITMLIINLYQVHSLDLFFDICFGNVPPTTSNYNCIRQNQPEIALWLYNDQKGINSYSVQSFTNARNAGLRLQIGFSPCRTVPA